jgi:hypothetical protein
VLVSFAAITDVSGIMFNDICGPHGPIKLTRKINPSVSKSMNVW